MFHSPSLSSTGTTKQPSSGGSVSSARSTPTRRYQQQHRSTASSLSSSAADRSPPPRLRSNGDRFHYQINEQEEEFFENQSRQPKATIGSSRVVTANSSNIPSIARSSSNVSSGRRRRITTSYNNLNAESYNPHQTNNGLVPQQHQQRRKSLSPPRSHPQHRRVISSEQNHGTPPTHPNTHTTTQHCSVALASTNSNISNTSEKTSSSSTSSTPAPLYSKKSVKKIIDDLNKAIGHDRRVAAIANACEEFDHWDNNKHDLEISLGAANVLSLFLSMTSEDDEVQMRMICAALEMVYRASSESLIKSYKEVGGPLIPVLLRFLESCEKAASLYNNNPNNSNKATADVSIINISKVLLYFSRVPALRTSLIKQHSGLLPALTRITCTTFAEDNSNISRSQPTVVLNPESRIARIRIIANLANEEENRATMYEHPGLVDSIVTLAHFDYSSDSTREYATAALMDLAGTMQIEMAQNAFIINTLIKLCTTDRTIETREYAITALQNIAFAKENRESLVKLNNAAVLEALKQTLALRNNQSDSTLNYDKVRRRAAGALTNLVCKETVELLGNHDGLLDVLTDVVTRENDSEEVQQRVIIALSKIANSIVSSMSCHNLMLGSLIKAASSSFPYTGSNNGISVIAGILRNKARIVENRYSMARYPQLLETLSAIAINSSSCLTNQEDAIRAIMHLTNEKANRKLMGVHKKVLDALVFGVTAAVSDGNTEEKTQVQLREIIQDSSLTAMERLASDVTNRRTMARHDGLLVAMAKATERETKISDMTALLSASDPGNHTSKRCLAKALLMSLLVAL